MFSTTIPSPHLIKQSDTKVNVMVIEIERDIRCLSNAECRAILEELIYKTRLEDEFLCAVAALGTNDESQEGDWSELTCSPEAAGQRASQGFIAASLSPIPEEGKRKKGEDKGGQHFHATPFITEVDEFNIVGDSIQAQKRENPSSKCYNARMRQKHGKEKKKVTPRELDGVNVSKIGAHARDGKASQKQESSGCLESQQNRPPEPAAVNIPTMQQSYQSANEHPEKVVSVLLPRTFRGQNLKTRKTLPAAKNGQHRGAGEWEAISSGMSSFTPSPDPFPTQKRLDSGSNGRGNSSSLKPNTLPRDPLLGYIPSKSGGS